MKEEARLGRLSAIRQGRRERAVKNGKRSPLADCPHWTGTKRANEQVQSLLFSKLPTELRIIIWQMVMCDTERIYVSFRGVPGDELRLSSSEYPEMAMDYGHRMRDARTAIHVHREHDVQTVLHRSRFSRATLLPTCKRV